MYLSIRFLNHHMNESEKAFEYLADDIHHCSYPSMKTGMGTNALKSAVEVSSRVRMREGAAKVNK